MEALTKIILCMYVAHIIGADVTITIQKEAAEPPIQNATIGPSSNGTEFPFLITEPSETESDGTTPKSNSISTTQKSTPVELLDMEAYIKPFETNAITDSPVKNVTNNKNGTTEGSQDSSITTVSPNKNETTPSLLDTISTIIVENINKMDPSQTSNKAQNSTGDSINGTSSSTVSPSSSTTLVINFNVTEQAVSASPEDILIPPADVNASIAQIDTQHNKKGQIIISSEPDCPSLIDADSLSQTQLLQRLTHGCRYDRLERPLTLNEKGDRLPVNVSARAYIYFLQNLEAHDLQFKIHALLQLRFVDPRLVFKEVAPKRRQPILGENSLREALWVPHIFLANERDSSILGTAEKDVLTSISPDGTVIISTRIQATLYCWMNLQKFPFDEQHCSTVLESWMYNTSELVLHWENKSPVTLAPELHLTEYVLLNTWTNQSVINADLSDLRHGAFAGNYSSLSFTVHLAREMGFYLMDYFLPSMMIVAISWVSFWLQADQSAPRIMLGTSTMLTFITLASAQGKTLPKVSYIKVSEVWFLGCTGFIFGSLVEFAFVNTIWRRKKNVELKKVNSKYILKSTLTPRPARKEMGLHKSRSCSSLNGTGSDNSNNVPYNNYLTVHSFPSKTNLPIITTQSVDDLSHENGSLHINMEPSSSITTLPMNKMSTSSSVGQSGNNSHYGWTTMTPQEISMWIDRRSRFLFPCAFVIFNAFFWTFVYYL